MAIKALKDAADLQRQLDEFSKGMIVEGNDSQAFLMHNGALVCKDRKSGNSCVFNTPDVIKIYYLLDKHIDEIEALK